MHITHGLPQPHTQDTVGTRVAFTMLIATAWRLERAHCKPRKRSNFFIEGAVLTHQSKVKSS